MRRRYESFGTVALAACLLVAPAMASAQQPWAVTVTPTLNPLAIGFCGAVRLTVVNASGGAVPRNGLGYLVTMADFDMAVTGASVAGHQIDSTHYDVCACPGGSPGGVATVTATYPARALAANAVSKDVQPFTKSATFVLAMPKGTVIPPSCVSGSSTATAPPAPAPPTSPSGATLQQPIGPAVGRSPAPAPAPAAPPVAVALPPTAPPVIRSPAPGLPPAPAAIPAAGVPPTARALVPINPSGLTAMEIGPGQVRLSWQAVNGASFYGLFGPGVTAGGEKVSGATTFTATAVPAGNQEWSVGSFYEPGNVSTAATAFTKVTLNVKPVPVNPSGFSAVQTGPSQVTLTWQPVNGASFYGLFGPGLAGGAKVSGATTFTVTGVPAGDREWSVGSFYEPGIISTAAAAFTKATLKVTAAPTSTLYRVVATGFRVVKETHDNQFDLDGLRNEVYGAFSMFHFRSGGNYELLDQDLRRTQVHGDNLKHTGRVRAGSASSTGGLREGDAFPSEPHLRAGPITDHSFPFHVWEGFLTDDTDFEILYPTLWEWGGDEDRYNYWFYNLISNATSIWTAAKQDLSVPSIVSFSGAGINPPAQTAVNYLLGNLGSGFSNLTGGLLDFMIGDRPLGLVAGRLPSVGLLLTRRGIEGSLSAAGSPTISIAMPFVDDPGDPNLRGSYILYLQVERVPPGQERTNIAPPSNNGSLEEQYKDVEVERRNKKGTEQQEVDSFRQLEILKEKENQLGV